MRRLNRPVWTTLLVAALVFGACALYLPTEPATQVWVPIQPDLDVSYLANAKSGPYLASHAFVLLERQTGTVIYGKNENVPRAPASITKIMTALLALENGNLNDIVTVSRYAASTHGSSAHLYTGQKIRLEDLLYGMLLRSGNDAAVAVAEYVAGSVREFSKMMNERAAELGAKRTRFSNPHGLDQANHFSTAFDLAMIAKLALQYPKFAEIVSTPTYTYEERGVDWQTTNRLLRWGYPGVEGIKTGTTGKAGNCLATAATRGDMQLISVVLGSMNRWRDTTTLLEYGFDNFSVLKIAEKGAPLAEIRPPQSSHVLTVMPADDLLAVVPTGETTPLTTRVVWESIKLPIVRNQRLGVYEVYAQDQKIADIPLLAARSVPRPSWWQRLWFWVTKPEASPPL